MHNDRYKMVQDLADGWLAKYRDCVRQLTEAHARIDRFESEPKGGWNKEVESLRQQLNDSQKREVMLREVVNRNIECIHFEDTGPEAELCVVFSREALAATADMKDVILCHAEPAAIVYRDYGRNGAILQTELADDEPLYRARGDSK